MTSSISPSEPGSPRLRRWVVVFAATFFGGAALLYAVLILVDPYDSGRFPSLPIEGVSDSNLRTSDVSRARDGRFDSAVFGSSTGMAIDPARLSSGTGLRFVQLSFSHGNPREIVSMIGWFLRHRSSPGAVVLIADDLWCTADGALPPRYPFPHWLYGSDAGYLAAVLNWKSFDRVAWRVSLALGLRAANDPVGYQGFHYDGPFQESPNAPAELSPGEAQAPFVWIDRLAPLLDRAMAGTSVVVVFPPAMAELLPAPGTRLAERLEGCKRALATRVARPPHGNLIDERVDGPEMHDRSLFYDRLHYRAPLARRMEDRIIATLTQRTVARPSGQALGAAR